PWRTVSKQHKPHHEEHESDHDQHGQEKEYEEHYHRQCHQQDHEEEEHSEYERKDAHTLRNRVAPHCLFERLLGKGALKLGSERSELPLSGDASENVLGKHI
ncbi:MAG: hypothetical protein ACXV2E_06115, partial [Halobacteriota archaeon]